LAEERAGTPALYALIGIACQRFERWVGLLQQGAAFRLDPSPMIAAATALREAQPHEAAFEALAAQSEEAAIAQAAGPAIEAVVAGDPVEVAEPEVAAPEVAAPEVAAPEVAEPEVAEPEVAEPEVVPPMVVDESITISAPWIETGSEVTGNVEEIAATADATHAADAGRPAAGVAEVRVGDRTISRPLYDIFLSEADDLIAALAADVASWADESSRPATETAQRAMHSLKGSAALVELDGVQAMAEQLESFLLR